MSGSRYHRQSRTAADVALGTDHSLIWLDGAHPGEYTAALYDNTPDLLSFAAHFVRDGLGRGERCLYLVDDSTPGAVTAALSDQGIDVARATARGALLLVSAHRFDTAGSFDIGRLIKYLRTWAAGTGPDSFTGVRIAAEMTWACRAPDADEAVMIFDTLFDAGIGHKTLTGAGMYRYGPFGPAALRGVIQGHRHLLASHDICVGLSPMLQGLTEDAKAAFLDAAGERLIPKGWFLYNQGDETAEVFVLTQGRVAFSRTGRDGQRVMNVDVATPSDVFGYSSIVAGIPRAASAVALHDSRALVWDAALFRRTITAHPDIAAGAIEYLARLRVNEWHDLRILATERVEQRLARVLWRLAETAGRRTRRGAVIELALSGQDLAEMAATTPYTISRILATWRRGNIVDARRDRIQIADAERLTSIARSGAEAEPFVS